MPVKPPAAKLRLALRRQIGESIIAFEPRIDASTLAVEVSTDGANHHNCMRLIIRGKMWNQPVPLELLLSADVDVETGLAAVRDMRN